MSRIRADRYTNREGTGAPTFSEGVNVVGVTSMSGDLAVTNGTITGPSQLTISGITSSISDTAVDVFVYDTSKDSDGGEWRKRTQNTSWYNETLNTATRGSRKEFPAVAVLVLEATQLTIYDGDDPDLPMWMVFNADGGAARPLRTTTSSISMLNGLLVTTSSGNSCGFVKFISDFTYHISDSGTYDLRQSGVVNRNVSGGYTLINSASIINTTVNDVAMTVLPNAPIDDTTGLPIPTIAVTTDGGLSIIKDDGTVANNSRSTNETYSITFDVDNSLIFSWGTTDGFPRHITRLISNVWSVTSTNTSLWPNNYFSGYNEGLGNSAGSFGGASGGVVTVANSGRHFGIDYGTGGNPDDRLGILHPKNLTNYADQNLSAFITSSYNTGYMHGNIKLATLSDTDSTGQTGGTVADRSINNNPIQVYGTITRPAVATGADLVAYSGFSASNNLVQPYNSDLNFGTGNFSIIAWVKKETLSTNHFIIERSDGSTETDRLVYWFSSSGQFGIYYAGVDSYGPSSQFVGSNNWRMVSVVRRGAQVYFGLDGLESQGNNSFTANITGSGDENLVIAQYGIGTPGNYNYGADYGQDGIVNLRLSASAPTPEQIKKIYNDEKHLFQENAKATLYGSSDLPTALAYDDTTELLHVGTSAGRSEFQGLRRINNTTVGITTAISASNGLVAEQ